MKWLIGLGGGGAPQAPNPFIASSGKWVATCVGVYAAIFLTPDVWAAWEDTALRAIHARYQDTGAVFVYWLLKIGVYPMMFFAVRMGLGIVFVSLVMFVMTKAIGRQR